MRVLLDTCAFLWLALEPARLSKPSVKLINDPANELFLSDVSVWEVTLKHTAGKLSLPDTSRSWIPSRRAFFGLNSFIITEAHILRTADLPLVHLDPFDRLLAAQALESGLTILSPDTSLSVLGAARVW
jgi:PIN domain nuclease of toxin-antitoxin system